MKGYGYFIEKVTPLFHTFVRIAFKKVYHKRTVILNFFIHFSLKTETSIVSRVIFRMCSVPSKSSFAQQKSEKTWCDIRLDIISSAKFSLKIFGKLFEGGW